MSEPPGRDTTPTAPDLAVYPPARRSSRSARIVLGVVLTLSVAVVVSCFVTLDQYAITPGQATSVIPLISVGSGHAEAHKGSVLLTDVELVPLRAIDYLFYKWNGDDNVVPSSEVTGTLTSAQYNTEGIVDMATARQAATVVALRTLGYPTTATANGVVDYAPESPQAPATGTLDVGDVIVAIDGRPTLSYATLESVLGSLRPGDKAEVTFHPFAAVRATTKSIALGTARDDSGAEVCARPGEQRTLPAILRAGRQIPCLGIEPDQLLQTVDPPFAISMNAEGIIGPSAGLAFTLGLIEKLDAADLTGGARIAATGTMAIDGTVGDVGGVAQKTVAVRRAGATVFFVPTPELATAEAHAGPDLKVFAVANVHQAIVDLERMGGRVVRPTSG